MPLLSTGISRRRLVTAAAVGFPAILTCGRAFAAQDPFTQGVASGDPLADGFVIWTRIAPDIFAEDGMGGAPDGLPVRWEVARDEGFRHIVKVGEALARRAFGSTLHIEVSGLEPDRSYWYRFIAQGVNSPTGRAWTAPRPDAAVDRVRFTAASCSHWEWGYFSAYRHMAQEEDSRFTLFLGDYIYESPGQPLVGGRVRSYGDLPEADSLANYRRRYALHHSDPDLQALHAAAPAIAIWDDHEVQDDYSGIWSKQLDQLPPARFRQRRQAAYQAFVENLPVRLSRVMRPEGYRINNRLLWGRLAQFDALDGRQFRSPPACIEQGSGKGHMTAIDCPDLEDPSRTFLGFEQERWLYEGWNRSTAEWNVLVQNLLIAPMVFDTPKGPVIWTDTWNGFGAARRRLIDAMVSSGIRNPVTLAGDYHSFWANNLYRDFDKPGQKPVAAEFVVSSITSSGPPESFYKNAMHANPQIRYFDSTHRGYMAFDLGSDRLDVRMMAISDRTDREATARILHSASVEAGVPGLT